MCHIARKATASEALRSGKSSTTSRFTVGQTVVGPGGKLGILRFLGPVQFAQGEWAGIELEEVL